MNILITGAGGYLGTELIKQLINTEHKVYALTSNKEKLKQKFGDKVISYSNEQLKSNKVSLQSIDVVIHCAFARAHRGGAEIAKSVLYTTNLFEKIKRNNVPAIINISTQEVYGDTVEIRTESMPPQPNSVYGTAKYFTELFAMNLFINSNTTVTNIRLPGLIGVGADTRMVSKFIDNALNNKPINILDSELIFSQLDIRDAAAGLISLIKTPQSTWQSIYNLGYIKSYSIQEIAETVSKVAKKFNLNVKVIKEPSEIKLHVELNSIRLYKDTNWEPTNNMKDTVTSIFEYKLKHK